MSISCLEINLLEVSNLHSKEQLGLTQKILDITRSYDDIILVGGLKVNFVFLL